MGPAERIDFMGEYAQDAIDAGMAGRYPFGRRHRRRHGRPHRKAVQAKESPPENVDDDHFTWWFDAQEWTTESPYEIAAMAWNEAVRRCGK